MYHRINNIQKHVQCSLNFFLCFVMIAPFDQTRIHQKNLLHAVCLCFDKITQPQHQKTHSHCTGSWSNFILRELIIFTVECTIFISCIIIIFQGGVPFSIKNAKYWPVLAILRTCRHTFYRTKYCGSLPKIRGMGIYSNTHNTIRCTESKSKDRCCCQEDEIAIMFVIQIIMITIKKLIMKERWWSNRADRRVTLCG